MKLSYSQTLILTAEAAFKREAERFVKANMEKVKAFARAFSLSCTADAPSWGNFETRNILYHFPFTLSQAECEFGDVCELAAAVRFFARFNNLDLGEEKVSLAGE